MNEHYESYELTIIMIHMILSRIEKNENWFKIAETELWIKLNFFIKIIKTHDLKLILVEFLLFFTIPRIFSFL